MSKKALSLGIVIIAAIAMGCGESGGVEKRDRVTPNANANVATFANVDPANRPEGLSGEIINPANAPGISNNPASVQTGTAPTPGIPSASELKKPFKPGTTPTPGIPDEATIRKALGQKPANTAAGNQQTMRPMTKSTNKPNSN